jgi:hypothetical protein
MGFILEEIADFFPGQVGRLAPIAGPHPCLEAMLGALSDQKDDIYHW